MVSAQTIWINFKSSFCKALDCTNKDELRSAWSHITQKTAYYRNRLMVKVADYLNLNLSMEMLRFDFAFVNDDGVPVVFVEAENAHTTARHEIKCLCCVAAPLKVLMISCDWKTSEKRKFLPQWIDIIRVHHAVVSVDCLYAVIVGEWQGTDQCLIEYSFTLINTAGDVVEESCHPIAT